VVHNSASQLSLTISVLMVESLAGYETGCWLLEQYLLDIKRRNVWKCTPYVQLY